MTTNYHFHIHKIVNVSHARIQQSTIHKTQKICQNRDQLVNLLQTIQEIQSQLQLEQEQQKSLNADLKAISAQLELQRPRSSIIKACLKSLAQQLEQTITAGLSQDVAHKLSLVLGKII